MLFRLTQKTQKQLKIQFSQFSTNQAENRYCEWICDTVQCGRKKYLYVVNAYSGFGIFFNAKGYSSVEKFTQMIFERMEDYFIHRNLQKIYEEKIKPFVQSVNFSKTNSRTMTGIMTDYKKFIEYAYERQGDFPENYEETDYLNDMVSCALDSIYKKFNADEVFVSEYMNNPVFENGIPSKHKEWK